MNSDRANRGISSGVNDLCDRELFLSKWVNLIKAGLYHSRADEIRGVC